MQSNQAFAPVTFDNWTAADYKRVMSSKSSSGLDWMAPTWVGEHRRRLEYYRLMLAYRDNTARSVLRAADADEREEHEARREYGDAALIIETIRAAVVGDSVDIVADEADQFEEGGENPPEVVQAKANEEIVRAWADNDRFLLKMIDHEKQIATFGDSVLTLGFDAKAGQWRSTVYDPGFYFPVLDDGEFPNKVHIAWELTDAELRARGLPTSKIVVHRVTWELRDSEPYRVPWEEKPATVQCFFSEGEWTLDSMARSPDDFNDEKVTWVLDAEGQEQRDVPLGIDFLPVYLFTDTVAGAAHFGKSVLTANLQLYDDLHSVDSDMQASAALTGGPMLAINADPGQEIVVGPKQALKLGPNGRAEMLSGAEGLVALAGYRDDLLERLNVNARIPATALGRVKPNEVPSGFAVQLSFSPMRAMIEEKRMVRGEKYALFFKHLQRCMVLTGELDAVVRVEIRFGSYLPSDLAATVTMVTTLLQAKAISKPTALRMLQESGIPIEDVAAELAEINKSDFAAATELFTATGNETLVANFLGVEPAPPIDATTEQPPNVAGLPPRE